MAKDQIVTLLTDFGTRDPYVAAMKGVILSACPRAAIVDICHDVPAHDVLAAAVVLWQAAPHFPPGSLHVVVVDPGVGTDRAILAGRFGRHAFLVPDNGVISLIASSLPLEEIVSVRNTQYLPPAPPSGTFHGRDVFAPLAGHILAGLELGRLGPQPDSYKMLEIPTPRETENGIVGQVLYVDRFGNLVSNVPARLVRQRWADPDRLSVTCDGRLVGPVQAAYDFAQPGETLALFNSMGMVEVAVCRGRACDELGASVGTEIEIFQRE